MINSNPFPSHINQLVTQPIACWLDVQYIAIQNYGFGVVPLSVIKATLEGGPSFIRNIGGGCSCSHELHPHFMCPRKCVNGMPKDNTSDT